MTDDKLTVRDLLFAATTRCRCGAGMAYPPGEHASQWVCSAVLLEQVTLDEEKSKEHRKAHDAKGGFPMGAMSPVEAVDTDGVVHIALPFWCYEVLSEGQPSARGATTRPQGSHVECLPKFKCKCGHEWTGPQFRQDENVNLGYQMSKEGKFDCPKCGEKTLNPDGSSNLNVKSWWPTVVVMDDEVSP